jgi:hypothetical protein
MEIQFEDTIGVIRSRKPNQTDNTMAKRTNNNLQNTTKNTKDRATWTHWKPGVNSGAPEG